MLPIIPDFIIENKIGLYCAVGEFYLDPRQAVKQAIISHAHADHAVPGNQQIYSTEATQAFMLHRYQKTAGYRFHIKKYHENFAINGVHISFLPAGHILGSAMVRMEYKGVIYLYTGDYKLEEDRTCETAELTKADVLITESTFAYPNTKHPNPITEIKKLNAIESNIMLGAYPLGKSQRLIALLNQHCPSKTILLHHNILPLSKIYTHFGIHLGNYLPYDRKLMKQKDKGMVYLVPPLVYNSYLKATNVVRVFASGWSALQKQNEVKLFISDHVDWADILKTIAQVKPSQVWTTHGNGINLQAHFEGKLIVKSLNN